MAQNRAWPSPLPASASTLILGRSALISWPWDMFASSILSLSLKDCDCDVTRASIGPSGWYWSVQLQPFGCQRAERSLVVVPGSDDLVHSLYPDAEQGADAMLLAPALLKLARQRVGLAGEGEGEEAVAPAMPRCLEAARHALGPQRLEGGRQQGLLCRMHGTLLENQSGCGPT